MTKINFISLFCVATRKFKWHLQLILFLLSGAACHAQGREELPSKSAGAQGTKAGAGLLTHRAALGAPEGSALWERLCPESEVARVTTKELCSAAFRPQAVLVRE